jgi:hypothetical protein
MSKASKNLMFQWITSKCYFCLSIETRIRQNMGGDLSLTTLMLTPRMFSIYAYYRIERQFGPKL